MIKRIYSVLAVIITATFISCKPAKFVLDIPENNLTSAENINVSGVKGKRLPGSKHLIKYDRQYTGTLKDGWVINTDMYDKTPGGFFSNEAIKRSLLLNFGIGINDVSSKRSDKYQFTISDSNSSAIIFCKQFYFGKSKEYKINNRVDFSVAEKQISSFIASVLISSNGSNTDWKLELSYERETPGGIISTMLKEGMPAENGYITNKNDTIYINTIFAKARSGKNWEKSHSMPFPIVGGYEFKIKNFTIGMVDVYNSSIWFFIESEFKTIVAAASTALLLRRR